MATQNFTVAPDNTSTATHRVWVAALFAAIDAILTRVAQTGDGDGTAANLPGAGNTKSVFRCWRFNDTAQATHPIYIRIDAGTGSAVNQPAIWIQVGNSLDSSGNLGVVLGGNLMAIQQVSPSTAGSATTFVSHVSGDSGRLTMELFAGWLTTSQSPWVVNIERCPDINGNYQDNAVGVDVISATSTKAFTLTKDGRSLNVAMNSNSFLPWPFDDSATTAALGLRVACFPILRIAQSRIYNAVTGILIYHNADYDGVGNETVSVYGSNKTYYVTQRGLTLIASASTVHRVMVRND